MKIVMWFKMCFSKLRRINALASSLQRSKLFISTLILLVIGFHALPVLQGFRGKKQTFWPFMSWSMYRGSYSSKEPIRSMIQRTTGITSAGQELDIESMFSPSTSPFFNLFRGRNIDDTNVSGLGYFALTKLYLTPMWEGDFSAARELADLLNRGRDTPIVEFRLESQTYTVTDAGMHIELSPVFTYRILD
jgi:hypothetical protein